MEKNIYPIGKYEEPAVIDASMRADFIERIASLPERLLGVAGGLHGEQLKMQYREGGWNVQQIVHHICDSHMNAYIRFKLALTEENPTIKPYDENSWSQLKEPEITDISTSLNLLKYLHIRWVATLNSTEPSRFKRTYFHPQYQKATTLDQALALYAWHSDHHLAQIVVAINRIDPV